MSFHRSRPRSLIDSRGSHQQSANDRSHGGVGSSAKDDGSHRRKRSRSRSRDRSPHSSRGHDYRENDRSYFNKDDHRDRSRSPIRDRKYSGSSRDSLSPPHFSFDVTESPSSESRPSSSSPSSFPSPLGFSSSSPSHTPSPLGFSSSSPSPSHSPSDKVQDSFFKGSHQLVKQSIQGQNRERYQNELEKIINSPLSQRVRQTASRARGQVDYTALAKEFKTLGAVSLVATEKSGDQSHGVNLGVPTPEIMSWANNFMQAFYANPRNRATVVEAHQHKVEDLKTKQHRSVDSKVPGCISFVKIILDGFFEAYFITISSPSHRARTPVVNALHNFVRAFQQEHKSDLVFFIDQSSRDYDEFQGRLVNGFSSGQNNNIGKGCSERFYTMILAKLFYQYGRRIQISGIVNLGFYPFLNQQGWGITPAEAKNIHEPRLENGVINRDTDQFCIPVWGCCGNCQSNKPAILALWLNAQQAGNEYQQSIAHLIGSDEVKSARPRRGFSPLRDDVAQYFSFTNQFNLNDRPAAAADHTEEHNASSDTPVRGIGLG